MLRSKHRSAPSASVLGSSARPQSRPWRPRPPCPPRAAGCPCASCAASLGSAAPCTSSATSSAGSGGPAGADARAARAASLAAPGRRAERRGGALLGCSAGRRCLAGHKGAERTALASGRELHTSATGGGKAGSRKMRVFVRVDAIEPRLVSPSAGSRCTRSESWGLMQREPSVYQSMSRGTN